MPNIYPFFDAGTFESFSPPYANPPAPAAGSEAVGRTTEDAQAGTHSLLLKYGTAGGHYNQDYKLYFGFRAPAYPIVLVPGKRYKATIQVKTPATADGGGQLGTDGVKIFLGKDYDISEGGVVTTVLAGATVYTMANGDVLRVVTVGQIKGAGWAEISIAWTEPSTGTPGFRRPWGVSVSTAQVNTAPVLAVALGEDVYNGGKLFMDTLTLEEIITCDLTGVPPFYTKTDETAAAANDGTVNAMATSSYSKRFAIHTQGSPPPDDADPSWQLSPIFTGVAPGVWAVSVKDLNGCYLQITNIPILEFAGAPPPPPPDPVGDALTVNSAPINSFNFISWYASSGQIDFSQLVFTNCFWDLPNAYQKNKIQLKHFPVVTNGERFSFYLNFDTDYNYPNFSSLRLDLINIYGVIQTAVGTLQRVFQADGIKYFIYASVTLVGVAPGYYRLVITDTSTDAPHDVLFVSQEIEIMTVDEAPKFTARFRFRCSSSIYRFLYSEIPDFVQEIRLRVNVSDGDSLDGKIEQYRASSSGKLRNVSFDLDKWYEFETYFFDKLAHRATEIFQAHDIIIVNNKMFLVKGVYKWPRNIAATTSKGTLLMYEQAFSTINRYGDPDAIIITDPVLLGDHGGAILL